MGDGIVDANAVLRGTPGAVEAADQLRHAGTGGRATQRHQLDPVRRHRASGVLPFPRALYEQAITRSGVAVQTNLRRLRCWVRASVEALADDESGAAERRTHDRARQQARRANQGASFRRICTDCCRKASSARSTTRTATYASLYLDRLREIRDCDQRTQGVGGGYALTAAVARYLALWMSYEDTIRVADLKTRGTRFGRVRDEVRAQAEQIVYMTEFMHPRFEEVCETLPAGLGARLQASSRARRWFAPLFRKGRHIQTAHVGGFLLLYAVSGLRRWRRGTLRYRLEQERIGAWLEHIKALATKPGGYDAAVELAECQRLVKGYSDTHERGLKNYGVVTDAVRRLAERADLAAIVKRLRTAALADEEGKQLRAALNELEPSSS